ncbi:MAG TPA: PA-phosphatase, partial [Vicinamibacteria bacterium]|nr:PA-phosphatase [Vicinamibacteria bacterium]
MPDPNVLTRICAATLVLAAGPARAARAGSAGLLNEWSARAQELAAAAGMHPLRAPLTLALVHLAAYDAVNAVAGGHAPYLAAPAVTRPASAEAAAVEAAYRVLRAELPSQAPALDAARAASLAAVAEPGRSRGTAVGAAAAAALL